MAMTWWPRLAASARIFDPIEPVAPTSAIFTVYLQNLAVLAFSAQPDFQGLVFRLSEAKILIQAVEVEMKESPDEVTRLLAELNAGRQDALDRLIPLVYRKLRRLAGQLLKAERTGHTLQPTALVHEAYLRLLKQDHACWQNRGQFFGVAALAMRRILVDYARARATAKRTGHAARVDLTGFALPASTPQDDEILAVDEALDRLAKFDLQQGRVVELRYFAGLTVEETAEVLAISPRTVKRDWVMASAWLRGELSRKAHA